MARRLILDTGLLIAVEKGVILTDIIEADDDVVIASITLAELLTGVELADDSRRAGRQEFIDGLVKVLPVEQYDHITARLHAGLLAHVHRQGTPRGAHDLIIAATALATSRTLLTTDQSARFNELPGVKSTLITVDSTF
ncbi:MAG: PIN domain-containing protein [Rhodoglobus sp.]